MRDNYRDPETGETFFISFTRTVNRNGKLIQTDRNGKILTNPSTGNELEFIESEKHDFTGIGFLKSNNKETRIDMLKKRSKEHYKKEIAEVRYQKNLDLTKKFKDI